MELNDYQTQASVTDQTRKDVGTTASKDIVVALLGLSGEVGTLATAYKKFLRDGPSYQLYKENEKKSSVTSSGTQPYLPKSIGYRWKTSPRQTYTRFMGDKRRNRKQICCPGTSTIVIPKMSVFPVNSRFSSKSKRLQQVLSWSSRGTEAPVVIH